MKTAHEFAMDLWYDICHLKRKETPQPKFPHLSVLRTTEWSPKFEHYMRNRLLCGTYRHGQFAVDTGYAYIEDAIARMQRYLQTGNAELLVDAANLCMKEFHIKSHPHFHFVPTDDGNHAKKRKVVEL